MEKSHNSSFLKSLALAFGDGLLFGVAVKLAQGPSKEHAQNGALRAASIQRLLFGLGGAGPAPLCASKSRENEMTDLGPLAERLRNVEDRKEHTQAVNNDALIKFGEGLDGRVLEKVIVALEARLTEHVGQVDRRLAEIDAQVALDLKAVDTHTAAQSSAVEKAIQQIEVQVREYVSAAQRSSSEQIAGLDQRVSALQEALPAKFREIIDAVRQSLEARVTLELTELENRVKAGGAGSERLRELEARLRSEVEALAGRLNGEMRSLAEQQQNQTAPMQQALGQLETKLTTLREELPPKIRQIVETVEASMDARISASGREVGGRLSALEQALATLRDELPHGGAFRQVIDEDLRRHAEQVEALDRKLTMLQEELPPKIKAIVDAVRESLDARMAVELRNLEEQRAAQQQTLVHLQSGLAAFGERLDAGEHRAAEHLTALEQHAARTTAGMTAELEAIEARHRTQIEQLETRLAGEIHALKARMADRSPDLDKALQYAALLEARVEALEQKLQHSAEEAADRAAERVWQILEARLEHRPVRVAPVPPPLESITGLRQKSTSAEQNVLDLIAGIGQLFEKPTPKATRETPLAVEPEPVTAVHVEPAAEIPAVPPAKAAPAPPPEPEYISAPAPEPAPVAVFEPPVAVMPEPVAQEEPTPEPVPEDRPPVILFRPKDSGRKWRIPFVSSFLLMAAAIAWLEFM